MNCNLLVWLILRPFAVLNSCIIITHVHRNERLNYRVQNKPYLRFI